MSECFRGRSRDMELFIYPKISWVVMISLIGSIYVISVRDGGLPNRPWSLENYSSSGPSKGNNTKIQYRKYIQQNIHKIYLKLRDPVVARWVERSVKMTLIFMFSWKMRFGDMRIARIVRLRIFFWKMGPLIWICR